MNLSWLGLFLFTCGWLLAVAAFEPHDPSWPYLAGAGVLMFALSFPGLRLDRIPKRVYPLAIGPAVFAVLLPYPYRIAGVVALAGFVLLPLCGKFRKLTPAAGGLLLAGGVLTLQILALALFYFLSPGLKDAGFLAPLLHAALKVVGSDATLGDGIVYVATVPEIMRLWPTWDHLGLFFILVVTLGALPLVALSRSPWKGLATLLPTVAGYFVLRYLVFGIVEASGIAHEIAWNNSWNAVSILPLFIALTYWIPPRAPGRRSPARHGGFSMGPRQLSYGLSVFAAVFALAWYAALPDGGVKKQGRVLLDEYHSDWEWTEDKFDTEWYGMRSGYNYYNLFEYLEYYYHADRGTEPLTAEVLSNYDVLIIKTPTKKFSEDEIESIVRFVESGGGLYLIGDHTNVFGTSSYLNKIAERFGFRFRYDSTYQLATGALSLYEPPDLLPHPVVQNMPTFLFATSCSIEGGPFCRPVMTGYRLRTMAADYSQTSFFPEKKDHRDYGFGLFSQTISATRGKGRIVGFTDSTVFSNFFMFIPGKPELLLGTVEWLNRENSFPMLDVLFLAVFGVLILAAVLISRKMDRFPLGMITMSFVMAAAPLSIAAVRALNARAYPPPEPHTDYPVVAFEERHSWFFIPRYELTPRTSNDFQTFYVWTQRLGLIPTVSSSVEEAVEGADLVVFIDPITPFQQQERERLGEFVEGGGSVLLLDDRRNPRSTSNQLLSFFDLGMDTTRVVLSGEDSTMGNAHFFDEAGRIAGGTPLVATGGGASIVSYVERGEGMVMACSNSHIFEGNSMGTTATEPDSLQRRIYDLQFEMLRKLMDL
jgi:hypothetical protein